MAMRCNLQQKLRFVYPCCLTAIAEPLQIPPRRMRRVTSILSFLPVTAIGRFYGGDDGGDGGAGGDGSGAGKPGGDDAAKTGITEKQANDLITKAINARFATFEKNQAKAQEASTAKLLETLSGSIGATLDEKLAALKLPTGDDASGKKKPDATDLTQNPEFRALKKQNEDFAKELQRERDEKAKAKASARAAALHQKVEAELGTLGFTDAASLRKLLTTDGIVSYEDDDSDNVVFKDEEGGALPLKRGLESWAKTSPLAKRFMPAVGADGSGEHQHQSTQRSNGQGDAPKMGRAKLGQLLVQAAKGVS